MADLALWLSTHHPLLVTSATETLAPASDETLKAQVAESVAAFFDSLIRAAQYDDASRLYPLLVDWVETRSAPTEDDPTVMLPILTRLKQAAQVLIQQRCSPEDAVDLLLKLDRYVDDAATRLAALEAELVLNQLRNQLHSAEIQIERLDKSKSDFIAIAAHELKTPLTVIEGYAGILRGMSESPDQQAIASGLETGAQRLREIVDDIIDISMIDLRLLDLHMQPVWLHHILDAIEGRVRGLLRQRSLSLMIEREAIPSAVTFADPERLRLAVEKVVNNAIKYTPDGGEILISARELSGFVDLMVRDQGIGIASRDLLRIFDAFSSTGDVSLHSSGKTKYKGAGPGLGLPIAKGIIEAHGGTIWAESAGFSEADHPGSTFHIMIPMRNHPPPEAQAGNIRYDYTSEE